MKPGPTTEIPRVLHQQMKGCLGKHTFEAGSGVRGMFDLHLRYRGAGSISLDPDCGYVTGPPSVL